MTEDTRKLAADADPDAAKRVEERANHGKMRFVAQLNPWTRAPERERTRLTVDTRDLPSFDPESGRALADGER